jgi:RHS repeat-associated protein
MTGPAHEVETSYEPHRNLVTGVVNKAKPGGARSLLPASPDAAPAADSIPAPGSELLTPISSYIYANDLLGRRETISQGGDAFGMLRLGQNKVEVAYNDRSEVVGAVTRRGDIPVARHTYVYDGIGNPREAVSSRVTGQESREEKVRYEANALNQYAAIDDRGSSNPKSEIENPQFDPDGNLLEDTRNTYTWNADNNLIRVDAKDGSLRLDYVYDHQSRRTVRIETKQPGTKNEAQKTTYYLYDDWNLLAEIDAAPAGGELGTLNFEPATLFSWGRDLSGSLQGAGGVGGLLAISKVNPDEDKPGEAQLQTSNLKLETLFPTYDANGNIGQLIDESGSVVAAYAYDPFGNVTEMAGAEAAENPWRFSTKPVEAGTGWLYYGYRWYDAQAGRWVNRDPIEERGGVNLYGFVGNTPVGWIDVLGQFQKAYSITLNVSNCPANRKRQLESSKSSIESIFNNANGKIPDWNVAKPILKNYFGYHDNQARPNPGEGHGLDKRVFDQFVKNWKIFFDNSNRKEIKLDCCKCDNEAMEAYVKSPFHGSFHRKKIYFCENNVPSDEDPKEIARILIHEMSHGYMQADDYGYVTPTGMDPEVATKNGFSHVNFNRHGGPLKSAWDEWGGMSGAWMQLFNADTWARMLTEEFLR